MSADTGLEEGSNERDTFEIDGLDPIRTRRGTALHEIAGAAKYWQDIGKAAEAKLERTYTKGWHVGFGVGMFVSGVLVLFTATILKFLW
jgi:hypothetical protein